MDRFENNQSLLRLLLCAVYSQVQSRKFGHLFVRMIVCNVLNFKLTYS